MKKITFMILVAASLSYCQYVEGLVTTTMYGGLAVALGSGVNPGPSLCIEPIRNVTPNFGLGGHIDYSWISAAKPPNVDPGFRMGVHFIDAAFVCKGVYPFSEKSSAALEFDPGINLTYFYFLLGNISDNAMKPFYGQTFGISYRRQPFAFVIKLKTIFAEIFRPKYDNIFSTQKTISWMTFSVGIEL